MVMSATPSFTARKSYWRSAGCCGCRAAGPPPGLEGDPPRETENQEGHDRMEDPDPGMALAAPCQHDLSDEQQHQDDAHPHSAPAESRPECQEQEDESPEEDQVAEPVVKVEARRELVLAERPGSGPVRRVDRPESGRADLQQHGDRQQDR